MFVSKCTKKNVSDFPVTNQTLPGREGLNCNPTRESLVSDIPAGDGKMVNLFLQCSVQIFLCKMIASLIQSIDFLLDHDPGFSCAGR